MFLNPGDIMNEKTDVRVRGFIAKTTAQVLEGLETLSFEHKPTIEDDGTVSINA